MLPERFSRTWIALTVIAGIGWGCTSDPPSLAVQVCADYVVHEEIEGVRVQLLNSDRETLHSSVVPLVVCPEDRLRELPYTVTFRELRDGVTLVQVIALYEGVSFARTERRVEDAGEITISLREGCQGVTCSLGQTCVTEECEWTPSGSDECVGSAGAGPVDEADAGSGEVDDIGEPADAGETADTGATQPRYCPPEGM